MYATINAPFSHRTDTYTFTYVVTDTPNTTTPPPPPPPPEPESVEPPEFTNVGTQTEVIVAGTAHAIAVDTGVTFDLISHEGVVWYMGVEGVHEASKFLLSFENEFVTIVRSTVSVTINAVGPGSTVGGTLFLKPGAVIDPAYGTLTLVFSAQPRFADPVGFVGQNGLTTVTVTINRPPRLVSPLPSHFLADNATDYPNRSRFDLASHFTDADGDNLTYSHDDLDGSGWDVTTAQSVLFNQTGGEDDYWRRFRFKVADGSSTVSVTMTVGAVSNQLAPVFVPRGTQAYQGGYVTAGLAIPTGHRFQVVAVGTDRTLTGLSLVAGAQTAVFSLAHGPLGSDTHGTVFIKAGATLDQPTLSVTVAVSDDADRTSSTVFVLTTRPYDTSPPRFEHGEMRITGGVRAAGDAVGRVTVHDEQPAQTSLFISAVAGLFSVSLTDTPGVWEVQVARDLSFNVNNFTCCRPLHVDGEPLYSATGGNGPPHLPGNEAIVIAPQTAPQGLRPVLEFEVTLAAVDMGGNVGQTVIRLQRIDGPHELTVVASGIFTVTEGLVVRQPVSFHPPVGIDWIDRQQRVTWASGAHLSIDGAINTSLVFMDEDLEGVGFPWLSYFMHFGDTQISMKYTGCDHCFDRSVKELHTVRVIARELEGAFRTGMTYITVSVAPAPPVTLPGITFTGTARLRSGVGRLFHVPVVTLPTGDNTYAGVPTTIDLDEMFYDPEGQPITYQLEGGTRDVPNHELISVDGSHLVINRKRIYSTGLPDTTYITLIAWDSDNYLPRFTMAAILTRKGWHPQVRFGGQATVTVTEHQATEGGFTGVTFVAHKPRFYVRDLTTVFVADPHFSIQVTIEGDRASGSLFMKPGLVFDHETQSEVTALVGVADETGLHNVQPFVFKVGNIEDHGSTFSFGDRTQVAMPEEVARPHASITSHLLLRIHDLDTDLADFTVSHDHADVFTLAIAEGSTYTLQVLDGVLFDYETKPAYTLTVRVTNDAQPEYTAEGVFTVNVIDGNDPPVLALADGDQAVVEGVRAQAGVMPAAVFAVQDANGDELSIHVEPAHLFAVVHDAGAQLATMVLRAGVHFDHETRPAIGVTAHATDPAGLRSPTLVFTVSVVDTDDTPPQIDIDYAGFAVTENVPVPAAGVRDVATVTVADTDTAEIGVFGQASDARFTLRRSTQRADVWHLALQPGARFDHEVAARPVVTLTFSDYSGNSATGRLSLSVVNVNDNPPRLIPGRVFQAAFEHAAPGQALVYNRLTLSLYFEDPDGDTLSYEFSSREAFVDNTPDDGVLVAYSRDYLAGAHALVTVTDGTYTIIESFYYLFVQSRSKPPAFQLLGDRTIALADGTLPAGEVPTGLAVQPLLPNIQLTVNAPFTLHKGTQVLTGGGTDNVVMRVPSATVVTEIPAYTLNAGLSGIAEGHPGDVIPARTITETLYTVVESSSATQVIEVYSLYFDGPAYGQTLDHETTPVLTASLAGFVKHGIWDLTQAVRFDVLDVDDEAPVVGLLDEWVGSYAENQTLAIQHRTPIRFQVTDADTDLASVMVSHDNVGEFAVVGGGDGFYTLVVARPLVLDYEARPSYRTSVTVRDAAGNATSLELRLQVTDVNEGPRAIWTLAAQTFHVGGDNRVDIRWMFVDFEFDNLTYSASPAEHLSVSADGLVLTANHDTAVAATTGTVLAWSGTQTATMAFPYSFVANAPPRLYATGAQRPIVEGMVTGQFDTGREIEVAKPGGRVTALAVSPAGVFTLSHTELHQPTVYADLFVRQGAVLDHENGMTATVTATSGDNQVGTVEIPLRLADADELGPSVVVTDGVLTLAENLVLPANAAIDRLTYTTVAYTDHVSPADATLDFVVDRSVPLAGPTLRTVPRLVVHDPDSRMGELSFTVSDARFTLYRTDQQELVALHMDNNGVIHRVTTTVADAAEWANVWELGLVEELALDHEAAASYVVTATVHDASGQAAAATFTLMVSDQNDEPVARPLSAPVGFRVNETETWNVATLFHDDDGDTLDYFVSPGGGMFTIDANGVLTATSANAVAMSTAVVGAFDSPAPAQPGASLAGPAVVTFTFSFSSNRPPVIRGSGGQTLTLTDGTTSTASDTGHAFTVTDDDDITAVRVEPDTVFAVAHDALDSNNEVVTLRFQAGVALDHETVASYTATVYATDSGGNEVAATPVSVTVLDVDEVVPELILLSPVVTVTENVAYGVDEGLPQAVFLVLDDDATAAQLVVSHTEAELFTVLAGGTQMLYTLAFRAGTRPDHEAKASHTVSLTVTDSAGQADTAVMVVSVVDVDEPPRAVGEVPRQVFTADGSPHAVALGAYVHEDDGETLTWSVLSQSDPGFTISVADSANGMVDVSRLSAVEDITWERAVLAASDSSSSVEIQFTLGFRSNMRPLISQVGQQVLVLTDNTRTAAEAATGIGFTVSDPDGDAITAVELAAGTSTAVLLTHTRTGATATGQLRFAANVDLDHDTVPAYLVTLVVRDEAGTSATKVFTITVIGVDDEGPTLTRTAATVTISENVMIGANVGLIPAQFNVIDPDTGKADLTIEMSDSAFTMFSDGGAKAYTLVFRQDTTPDFEQVSGYDVLVTVTDGSGQAANATFRVEVADVNEAPTVISPLAAQTWRTSIDNVFTIHDHFGDPDLDTSGTDLTYAVTPSDVFTETDGVVTAASTVAVSGQTATVMVSDGTLGLEVNFTYSFIHNRAPVGMVERQQTLALTEGGTSTRSDTGIRVVYSDADLDDVTGFTVQPTAWFEVERVGNQPSHVVTVDLFIRAGLDLDHETQPAYVATMQASDERDGASAGVVVTVSVTDVDDTPPSLSEPGTVTLAENATLAATAGIAGAELTVTDPDTTVTMLTVTNTDDTVFTLVNGGSDKLFTLAFIDETVADHEAKDAYEVTVTVNDGTNAAATAVFTVTVPDVNEKPTIAMQLVAQTFRTSFANEFTVTDSFGDPDEGDTLTYTVTPSETFTETNGTVAANSNAEATNLTGTVVATDNDGLTETMHFTYSFLHNQFPTFTQSGNQTIELTDGTTSSAGATGQEITFTDPDSADTISTVTVSPATLFEISYTPDTNEVAVTLRFKGGIELDYDDAAKRTHVATVKATDSRDGESAAALVTVSVTPANDEAPAVGMPGTVTLVEEVARAANTGLVGGELTVMDADQDDPNRPTVTNSDATRFTMVNHNDDDVWTLAFVTDFTPDHEAAAGYVVTVTVDDNSTANADALATITVEVTDVDEAPFVRMSLSMQTFQTSVSSTVTVHVLFDDPDDGTVGIDLAYSVTPTEDFSIANGVLVASSDAQDATAQTATIQASDGMATATMHFTYRFVHNAPPAGTVDGDQTLQLTDNTTTTLANTGLAVVFTDADAEDTIEAVTVIPANAFDVSYTAGNNGTTVTVLFKGDVMLDYETQSLYVATVKATDNRAGESAGVVLTMTVTDVDDVAPVLSAAKLVELVENDPLTARQPLANGDLTVTDPDTAHDQLTVAVSGTMFTLASAGGKMYTLAVIDPFTPDHETLPNSYTVMVTVTDRQGAMATDAITVSIPNVNEAPTVKTSLDAQTWPTSVAVLFTVSDRFDDPDFGQNGDSLAYTVLPDTTFTVANGVVMASVDVAASGQTGTVIASDGGLSVSMLFTYTFLHNQFPTFTLTGSQSLTLTDGQMSTLGNTGHEVTFTDPDSSDTITTVSVEPSSEFAVEYTGNANEVVATLRFRGAIALDYETQTAYVATLKATDNRDGESAVALVTVNVTPVNDEAPTWSAPAVVTLTENVLQPTGVGFAGGAVTVRDRDHDASFGDMTVSNSDSGVFTMVNHDSNLVWTLAFVTGLRPDHEAKDGYTVMVTVDDGSATNADAVTTITVEVEDVNEVPTVRMSLAAQTFQTSVNTTVTINALFDDPDEGTDGTNLTYTVEPSADFGVTNGLLTASRDDQDATDQTGTVKASDGSLTATMEFTYRFVHNAPPAGMRQGSQSHALTDNTDSTAGNTGFTVVFSDTDANDTISTVTVEPATAFAVEFTPGNNGTTATLFFRAGIALNFEAKDEYVATVRAQDNRGGEAAAVLVTMSVTDVDDVDPTLTDAKLVSLTENTSLTALQPLPDGDLTVTDPDTAHANLVVSNSDGSLFTMVSGGGKRFTLAFIDQYVADHERFDNYLVTVTVVDGHGATVTAAFTVTIPDVNERPTIKVQLAPQTFRTSHANVFAIDTLFGDQDENDTLTYTVTPTAVFTEANGTVTASSSAELDNQTGTLVATDSGGETAELTFTYRFRDNQPPVGSVSGTQAHVLTDGQTSTAGDTGYTVVFTDGDLNDHIESVSVAPASAFAVNYISGNNGTTVMLSFQSGVVLNYEVQTAYVATIKATDNRDGESEAVLVTMMVDDVDDTAPTLNMPSVITLTENRSYAGDVALAGAVVRVTDPDSDNLTVTNSEAHLFKVVSVGVKEYALAFNTATSLNHEAKESHTVLVTVDDGHTTPATATITVTVTDVNEPPTLTRTIPDQTFLTSVTVQVDFAEYFTDEDEDHTLTYTFSHSSTASLTWFKPAGSELSVEAPAETTTVSVALTVRDQHDSATVAMFNITVIDRDIQKFAELLQEPAAELVALVARDIGTASAGRAAAAVSSGPSPALIAMLRAKSAELEKGELTLEKFLAGNSFSFAGANLAGGLGSLAYWGGGDYSKLEAKRDDATRLSWDGSLFGGNVGIELRTGDSVFGLGINHSRGDFDYRYRSGTDYRGTLEFSMNSVFPYFTHETSGGTELHGVVSAGRGEMKATEGTNCQTDLCYTSDLEQLSFLVGFNTPLRGDNLRVRGEVGTGQVTADMPESSQPVVGLGELSADTGHAELGLEYRGPASGTFRPSFLLGVRNDFGDAVEGWGAEVGARVASTATRGLTFDAGVRYVMRKDGYREYGVDGTFRYEPRLPGLGLRWQVRPGYGIDMGAQDVSGILDGLGDDRASLPVVKGARVKAEASYGLLLADGLFTPRLSYERGDNIRLYGLNLRYQVGAFSWTYGWKRKQGVPLEVLSRVELRF